jgi:hypothetical protein
MSVLVLSNETIRAKSDSDYIKKIIWVGHKTEITKYIAIERLKNDLKTQDYQADKGRYGLTGFTG